ncbi:MAG: ribonuclease P protein component [Planctomycetes bacterium]|nr:ribonuclease P protein component [Planctomycetota bacterium]
MSSLPKNERLRGKVRIGEIFATGSHAAAGTVMAMARPRRDDPDPEQSAPTRLCVVAGKKLARSAVVRNRLRRRLRAAYRADKSACPAGYDVVLIARRGLDSAPWAEVRRDVEKALARATRA